MMGLLLGVPITIFIVNCVIWGSFLGLNLAHPACFDLLGLDA